MDRSDVLTVLVLVGIAYTAGYLYRCLPSERNARIFWWFWRTARREQRPWTQPEELE